MTLSYIEFLEQSLKSDPPRQKGLRTRERIKIATAKVLERKGYHSLRVTDITEEANLAEGSFYVYFKDKTDAATTVLSGLLLDFLNLAGEGVASHSVFDAIRHSNRRWFSVCRANSGLMRCILQVGDEAPEFANLSQRSNHEWYERVAVSVHRRRGVDSASAMLATYMLGAMMDELVRKLIIYPDGDFHALLAELDADDDAVADAASVLWLRIMHPNETPNADLPPAAAKLAALIWP
jgi:TetR/AcrR family transcriptional repressor of nem operon